ncbi:MAG: alpha/beta fold hydrolase [Gammaproteobacteria bacterium]
MTGDIAITAADGQVLQGTVHSLPGARTWLLINSAMGVRRRYYRHLAAYLKAQGIGVLSYDYRGMGDSVLGGEGPARVRLEDWGRKDFPAAFRWLRDRHAPARVVVLGHSVGGQLLGIAPEVRDADALVGVATQSGHWRHWDGLERAKVFALWYAAIPLLTALNDRFPSSRLGLGQDIPSGVARQWAEWGRDSNYIRSPTVGPQPQFHDQVRCRLRTYLAEGDDLAPERAVRAWHDWFPNAERELVRLGPRNAAGRAIGHFGFFDPEVGAEEWPGLTDFIRGT